MVIYRCGETCPSPLGKMLFQNGCAISYLKIKFVSIYNLSHSSRYLVLFRYRFNYSIFLMATIVEYFFMCLLAILL